MPSREVLAVTRNASAVAGAVGGLLVAIVAVAMSAGLVIDDGSGFTLVDPTTGSGRGTITAGTDALYIYVLGFGVLGGAVIAYLVAAVARAWQPGEPRFRPGPVAVAGAIAGAVTAYITLRAGIGIGGSIVDEVVTLSAFRGIVIFLVAGAVAGAVVALTADRLSRPAALGLAGEAWPRSMAAFVAESMPAMVIPLLAIVVIAAAVVGIAQVFLAGGTVGAIVVASLVSVAILAGGAFLVHGKNGRPAND